jgi:REP element-mobilizing transposase RayT
MRTPYVELYVHLIWATWDRLPLLSAEIEERVFAAIAQKCREMNCEPLAIGGVEDHVHVLVQLNPSVAAAKLVQEIKGSSSHLVTHEIQPGEFFKWQGAYRAFTLRKSEVGLVQAYIHNQKAHHAERNLLANEEIFSEYAE